MTYTIKLAGEKYTVSHDNGLNFHALRYGEPWRDLTGDGLVLAMAQRIEELEMVMRDVLDGTLSPTMRRTHDGMANYMENPLLQSLGLARPTVSMVWRWEETLRAALDQK